MSFSRTPFSALLPLLFLSMSAALSAASPQVLPGAWTDAFTVATLPDGSLLVAQKSGLIDRLVPDGAEYKPPVTWADMGDNGRYELLGLAVDPNFLSSGYLFAVLKTLGSSPTVSLTRWRHTDGLVVLNRVLVDLLPSGQERTGGVVKFGPDGKLWVGLGDGGAPAAEVKPELLRGVLLRYNDDGSLPADNPDPASPVWAFGLRDPSGLAWQPGSERLYALDRGPEIPRGTMDEVNLIEKGANYGWPKHLGRETAKGVTKPVIYCTSGHTWVPGGAAFAVSGEWAGSLLYAGAGEGVLYRLSLDRQSPTKILFYEELINGSLGPLADVMTDGGKLYLLSTTRLYLLTP